MTVSLSCAVSCNVLVAAVADPTVCVAALVHTFSSNFNDIWNEVSVLL